MSEILLNKVFPGTPESPLPRGLWPQIECQSLYYVVNAQTHISSSANQSQKDEKGDGHGTAKVSKGITETWLQSQVSMGQYVYNAVFHDC